MANNDATETLALGLNRLGTALRLLAWHDADRRGLSPTQADILSYLAAQGGRSAPSQIAAALGVSGATVSDSLRALQAKGHISRARAHDDARRITAALTPAGRRAMRAAADAPAPLVRVAESVSTQEQGALLNAVMKAVRILQEEQQISPAAMCVNCVFFQPYRYADPEKPHHCGFVDAPFGEANLQIECPDFEEAPAAERTASWKRFSQKQAR